MKEQTNEEMKTLRKIRAGGLVLSIVFYGVVGLIWGWSTAIGIFAGIFCISLVWICIKKIHRFTKRVSKLLDEKLPDVD